MRPETPEERLERWTRFAFPLREGAAASAKVIGFGASYQPGDSGQEILKAVHDTGGVVYVRLKRTWLNRLFSWPWRPWKAYIGETMAMRVTQQGLAVTGDDGLYVRYVLEQDG